MQAVINRVSPCNRLLIFESCIAHSFSVVNFGLIGTYKSFYGRKNDGSFSKTHKVLNSRITKYGNDGLS